MKKILAFIISALIITNCFMPFAFASNYIKGDVNQDGVLDIVDVSIMRGSIVGNIALSKSQVEFGDIDNSGYIDIVDVAYARGVIIGNIKTVYSDNYTTPDEIITTETDDEKNEEIMPILSDDVKGMWISYIEMAHYFDEVNESVFVERFNKIISNCKELGINTVFVQVRAHGDAYYHSALFPATKYLSGTFNKDTEYDALSLMTEICHKNGIKIHAWVNPYRLCNKTEMQSLPNTYKIKQWYNQNDGHLFLYNGVYYLNPAADGVTDLVADGVREILRYDVDGVQIDDYFYPTTDKSIDNSQFSSSGYSDLTQFRLDTCTKMVKAINDITKKGERKVLFGVSPQGNIPNNYDYIYADVKLWASSKEYVDYIAPQIYYGFRHGAIPFTECVSQWESLVKDSDVGLLCGLAAYKIGTADNFAKDGKYEWEVDGAILSRQIRIINNSNRFNGYIYFHYDSLFSPDRDVSNKVSSEIEEIKKIIK